MIKEARKKKSLTQIQLATIIGVSQPTISRLENNINYNCNIDCNVLLKLSNTLDLCPMKVLLYINPSFVFTCLKCEFSEQCVILSNYKR